MSSTSLKPYVPADEFVKDDFTGEVDPEEEERQRRAAIAARMARLGGARVGMGPPVFGKKPTPPRKKPSLDVKSPGMLLSLIVI